MATSADFRITLTIDSEGNAAIEEVKGGLQDLADTAQQANEAAAASAGGFVSKMVENLAIFETASDYIQQQWTAQKTTLDTIVSQIGQGGLAGAYEDVVGWVQQLNDYLRENRDSLIQQIYNDWVDIRSVIQGAALNLQAFRDFYGPLMAPDASGWQGIRDLLSDITVRVAQLRSLFPYLAEGAQEAGAQVKQKLLESCGPDVVGAFAAGMAAMKSSLDDWKNQAIRDSNEVRFSIYNAMMPGKTPAGFEVFMGAERAATPPAPKAPPPTRLPMLEARGGGGGGGGAGGAEAAANRLQSIMDTLDKELAKLTEGSYAEVDAWAKKMLDDLAKIQAKGADTADADAKVWEVAAARKSRLDDQFWLKIAKNSGDIYAELNEKYQQDLKNCDQSEAQKAALAQNYQQQVYEAAQKQEKEIEDLRKSSLETIAKNTPNLAEQLTIERAIMETTIARAAADLNIKLSHMQIDENLKDELRSLQALAAQAQRFEQLRKEWQTQGIMGGLKLAAFDWESQSGTALAKQVQDAMKSAQSGLGSLFGDILVNAWEGKKGSITQIMNNIFENALRGIGAFLGNELYGLFMSSLSKVFDLGATGLNLSSDKFSSMFTTADQGLTTVCQNYSSMFSSAISGLENVLSDLGGGIGGIAGFIGGLFHRGGLVAHRGLLLAHGGLAPDERLVLAQTGEGIINRDTMAAYARAGVSFADLNAGRLPAAGGNVTQINAPISISINPRQAMTQADYDRHIDMIKNSLNKLILRPWNQPLIGDKRY